MPLGVELCSKTLGVIGMGRAGTAVAERARGLGMAVIELGRDATPGERTTFFAASDAITIH